MRGPGAGPLRPASGGLQRGRARSERGAGLRRHGRGLPQICPRLCSRGGAGARGAARHLGRAASGPPRRRGTAQCRPRPAPVGSRATSRKRGQIFHLPGSRDYDRTRIDETRGERWFCTEAEARAAGWRPMGS
ncbi:sunset domain-containing protein [Rhodobacter capsulatus]|uniref:sunset domain-containing protein n=1 Tax=Rhodobacter capsulatus TaxID=1061 RepID=UPI0040287E5F